MLHRGGVERNEGHDAENARADHHVVDVGRQKGLGAQQGEVQDGIGLPPLVPREQGEEHPAHQHEEDGQQPGGGREVLGKLIAPQHEEEDGAEKIPRPRQIDMGSGPLLGIREQDHDEDEEPEPDRQVDVEDVPPGIAAHNPAAQVGPDDSADGEDAGKEADGLLPVLRELIAHDAGRRGQEAGTPDSLQKPEGHQAIDVRGQPTGEGAQRKQQERPQEDRLPAEAIAQVAHQGHHAGHRHHVDGERPRGPEDIGVELADEVWKSHRHGCTVDGIHEEAQRSGCKDQVASQDSFPVYSCPPADPSSRHCRWQEESACRAGAYCG